MSRRFVKLPDGRRLALTLERSRLMSNPALQRGVYVGTRGLSGGRPTLAFWLIDSTGTRIGATDYVRATRRGDPDASTLRAVLDAAGRILREMDPQAGEAPNAVAAYHGELGGME